MRILGFWALGIVALIAPSHATAQAGERIQRCIETIIRENSLSETTLGRLAPGTPLLVYGDVHALAHGESLTTLCVRTDIARSRERSLEEVVETERAKQPALQERIRLLESENVRMQGSFLQQHFAIGWFTAAFFAVLSIFQFLRARHKRKMEKKWWNHHAGSARSLPLPTGRE